MESKNTYRLSDDWLLEELRTLEQIEANRELWQSFQFAGRYPSISTDIDRYLSVWKAGGNFEPCILILRKNTRPKAMIIARISRESVHVKFGYKTIYKPKVKCLSVVYNGILAQLDDDIRETLVRGLIIVRDKYRLDCIHFDHLKVDSPFYQSIRTFSNILCRNHFPEIQPHWRMAIPRTIDEFLLSKSKKHRKHLRQYQNALERQFPKQIRMCTYQGSDDIEIAIQNAAAISKNSYQSGLGVGFTDNTKKRQLIQVASEKGWFRGHILYLNDQPASFRFALCYNGVYYGDGIGFDPKWKQFRVGTILFLKVLEELCQNKEVAQYDFGFGDADYKQSYGDESWREAVATYLFAPRFYPLAINLLNSINSAVNRGLMWVIKKCGVYGWLKRNWRKKLQKADHSKSDAG